MYQPEQQLESNYLSKYISASSPKLKATNSPIIKQLNNFISLQQSRFQQIQKGCTQLQTYTSTIQGMLDKVQQRVGELYQLRSTQTISNLRNKQNQFIINQLKDEIKKYKKNQQSMQVQVRYLKKQLENVKRQSMVSNQRQRSQGIRLKEQLCLMQKEINQKDQLIGVLNEKIEKLVGQKKQESRKQAGNADKLKREKQEEYKQLQNRLLEFQRQFDLKITSLQGEVVNRGNIIQELQEQVIRKEKEIQHKSKQYQKKLRNSSKDPLYSQGQQSMTATFNPSILKASNNYQLQLKLSQQQKLYKQLETQYTSHLTASNNLQIQLHQQIHQQKFVLQEQKKKMKNQKKKTIQLLQGLTSTINRRNFNYFESNELQSVIGEIKKIYIKQKQKLDKQLNQAIKSQQQQRDRITELQRQVRRHKSQSQTQKQQIQSFKEQIQKLLVQRQRQKQKKTKKENTSTLTDSNQKRNSLNGSFGDISNPNSKSESPSAGMSQKYRQMINHLRSQVKQKQKHISQLQKLQSIDFQKSKQRILSLESQFADMRNELKKMQRQKKQLNQTIQQLTKGNQAQKNSLLQVKQNTKKQKEQLRQQGQQKQRQLQQKILKLKEQNQKIDAKCQEKVMKYNKLKLKLEKLELYNNQTQKRKDIQIQQLIKKNQQLKMDCKLIQQKINILRSNQTNSGENTDSAQNGTKGYNRDLIEQIQMERDRILEQYEGKRRDFVKQKQKSQKLQQQKQQVQQQRRNLQQQRVKIEQQVIKLTTQAQKLNFQIQKLMARNNSLEDQKKNIITQHDQKLQSLRKELQRQKQFKLKGQEQISRLRDQSTNKSKQQYQHIKKQLQAQLQARKKLQKQQLPLVQRIKQLRDDSQRMKKQRQQRQKIMQNKYIEKVKQKAQKHHLQLNRAKSQYDKKIKELEQRYSEAAIREENLISIINYKNNSQCNDNVRESMKADEDQQPVQIRENLNQLQPIEQLNIQSSQVIVQTQDKQCNTQTLQRQLELCKLEHVQIIASKQPSGKTQLAFQNLENITIHPLVAQFKLKRTSSMVFNDKPSNANIFEEQEELFKFLKQLYPSVLDYLVNSSLPVEGVSTTQQLWKSQPSEQVQMIQIGINTDEQISQKLHPNSYPNENLSKQLRRQPLFLLQNQMLGSYHQSQQQKTNRQQIDVYEDNQRQQQLLLSNQVGPVVPARPKFNLEQNRVQQINLFENLKPSNFNLGLDQGNMDDNFEICEQGQSINVGQSAINLQIKQIFNKLRQQLQKVLNGQQVSLSVIKILPRQLQDDYNELVSYIREKIEQIKKQNQLSFIMAQIGDQQEQCQEELDNELRAFLDKKVLQDMFTYKRMAQQKQALINQLINEKTLQENTINQMTMQKQELDEQHENRFMNQCTIYKKEIKQLKKKLDALEMSFQSLKNVFRNTLEIWVDDMENQDDLRDNFVIYKKVGKLTELQATRLNYYIFKYRQIKDITD